jgi:hypothetical protein
MNPWMRTILVKECSSVNGFNTRHTRISSWAILFGLMKQHLSWMVQWIPMTVYWSPENSYIHVDKVVSLLTVWYGLPCRSLNGPFFFFKEQLLNLCTSTYFGHLFYLPLISSMGISPVHLNAVPYLSKYGQLDCLSIKRCPSKFINVTMWEHCTSDSFFWMWQSLLL